MPQKVTIEQTVRLPSSDPTRLGKFDLMIRYTGDGGGAGVVRMAAEDATDETVKAAIAADVAELGAWTGKTFEV